MTEMEEETSTIAKVPADLLQTVMLKKGEIDALKYEIRKVEEPIIIEMGDKIQEASADLRKKLQFAEMVYEDLLAVARGAQVYEQDRYVLVRSVRRVRTVDPAKFRVAFPEVFDRIATVPLREAEDAVGKDQLDPLVTRKEMGESWSVTVKNRKVGKTTAGYWE